MITLSRPRTLKPHSLTRAFCFAFEIVILSLTYIYAGDEVELPVKVNHYVVRFQSGNVKIGLGKDGKLEEFVFTINGKEYSIPKGEMEGMSELDLQSVRITSRIFEGFSNDGPSKKQKPIKFVRHYFTIPYGPCVVRKSWEEYRACVRYEFEDGKLRHRFRAVPEKMSDKWTIYFKDVSEKEQEFDTFEGTSDPWSMEDPRR